MSKSKLVKKPLPVYGEQAMLTYSSEVIQHRALPDVMDGLKPVQRRALYAMFKLGATSKAPHTKAARIVGETIGKYHCHGDGSVFEAMVKLSTSKGSAHVHPNTKSIHGSGNWGNLTDGNAAQRYINGRLSLYADNVFFNPKYFVIAEMVDNYDGKDKEPMVLPSLLPNIFLMGGITGIAVGVTTKIPSYSPESLLKVVNRILDNKKVGTKECLKYLEFQYPYGGEAILDNGEAVEQLTEFYDTGAGQVKFRSITKFNKNDRSVTVTELAPELNLSKVVIKVEEVKEVKHVEDCSTVECGYKFKVHIKANVPQKELKDIANKVIKMFSTSLNFKTNVTLRKHMSDRSVSAKFIQTTVPDILNKWVKWRIKLEIKSLTNQLNVIKAKLTHQELMLLAVNNRAIIIESLGKKDTEKYLVKNLNISLDQAKTILDLKVRQLRKLDGVGIKTKIQELKDQLKQLKNWIKSPNNKIKTDINDVVKKISKSVV